MSAFPPAFPLLVPMGDAALVVVFGEAPVPPVTARVRACVRRLAARPLPGVTAVVPAYVSVTVHYEPAAFVAAGRAPYDVFKEQIQNRLAGPAAEPAGPSRTVVIPVCYGGAFGPDLAEVAQRQGLDPAAVVALHTAAAYTVHLLGFAPGFPYLGGIDPRLAAPRRPVPRTRVPAGSVGIGGAQTGVYPLETPGGWNLIGRTPLNLFSLRRAPPALLQVGDTVRFTAITPEAFARSGPAQP